MELDDELVRDAVRGKPRAWRRLSQTLEGELRRYFARRRFQGPDVDDLSQETLTSILRKLPEYEVRDGQPFLAWVYGIARVETLKARGRQRRTAAQRNAAALVHRTPNTSLSALFRRAELVGILAEEIAKLPAAFRRAVEKRIESGESATVAVSDDMSPGAARTRLYRARLMLSKRLRARLETPPRPSPPSSSPPPSPSPP